MWKIDELLQIIKGQVEAREISDAMKVNEKRSTEAKNRGSNSGTASSLFARYQDPGRICYVYQGEGHPVRK